MIHGLFGIPVATLVVCSAVLAQPEQSQPSESSGVSEAVPASASIAPDAKLVVDQYIAATGGRSGWESIRTLQGNGSVSIPAAAIAGSANVMMSKVEYRRKFVLNGGPLNGAIIETGRNGDVIWQLTGEADQYNGKLIEGAERDRSLRQYQFNQLLDLEKNFTRVEVVDVEEIDGVSTMKVLMVPRENPDSREYRFFDQKSGLILRTIIEESGRPPQESRYTNYRRFGPIKMHTQTDMMTGGQIVMRIAITNYVLNEPLPEEIKEMPLEIKVLLGEGPDPEAMGPHFQSE
ncbi:MAG: hypothetical protein CMJ39_01215 [Phycisphaerae bacterium]|nr:hypothetical protein [Phycisphaerae bacterium]